MNVQPLDVIQLNPDKSRWGPLLVVVERVRPWGIVGYAMVPEAAGQPPAQMFLRVAHGDYHRIGAAMWAMFSAPVPPFEAVDEPPKEG